MTTRRVRPLFSGCPARPRARKLPSSPRHSANDVAPQQESEHEPVRDDEQRHEDKLVNKEPSRALRSASFM